jgi:hypothetical protein
VVEVVERVPLAHGYSRYVNYKCRCDTCRAALARYKRGRRQAAKAAREAAKAAGERYIADGIAHGRASYNNHSCRCEVCVNAWNAYRRLAWHRDNPPGVRGG